MRAEYCRYRLLFREPSATSRAVMTDKETYFVRIADPERRPGAWGVGECALFRGLSADDVPDYEPRLAALCADITRYGPGAVVPPDSSSMRFGVETALADLRNGGRRLPWPGRWTDGDRPIPINGLIWMGSSEQMMRRIDAKIAAGFRCIKLKIGGLDFADELALIASVRSRYRAEQLELRLDANGAFAPADALARLRALAPLGIHSIEQPIRAGQPDAMAELCRTSPIPIALDEELIGCRTTAEKCRLLDAIRPQYVILKPSLCGGFAAADEWADLARARSIGWWATSALESDIGLNAIAQWCDRRRTAMPQGLGTGQLFVNNVGSPLRQVADGLRYDPQGRWSLPDFDWQKP